MPPDGPTQMKLTGALGVALGVWAVGVQLNELAAAIGCYAALAFMLALRRPSLDDVKRWWPLAAFIGWGLVVPMLGGNLPTGTGLARLGDWLLVPAAAAAVAHVTPSARRRILIAAAATTALSCVAAGLQHFGLWPSEETLEPVLAWSKIPFTRVYEPVPGVEGRFMAGGLLFHRLRFAEVTGLVVVTAAAVGLHTRRFAALALAAVGFVSVLVFPVARAGSGALVLTLAGMVRPRMLAVALVLAAVLAVALTPGLRDRFLSSMTTKGSGERSVLVEAGLNAVAAHPLAGCGLGRFKPALFARPDASVDVLENAGKSHNQLVSIAAEGGIGHAVLFAVLLAWLGLRLFRTPTSAARTAGLAGLAFFALLSMVHDPLFHAVLSQGLALLLGGSLGLTLQPLARAPLTPALSPTGEREARSLTPPASAG